MLSPGVSRLQQRTVRAAAPLFLACHSRAVLSLPIPQPRRHRQPLSQPSPLHRLSFSFLSTSTWSAFQNQNSYGQKQSFNPSPRSPVGCLAPASRQFFTGLRFARFRRAQHTWNLTSPTSYRHVTVASTAPVAANTALRSVFPQSKCALVGAVFLASTPSCPNKASIRAYSRAHWYDGNDNNSRNRYRRWGRDLDPQTTVYTIIGINAVIFLAWRYAEELYTQRRDPRWLKFMLRHFTTNLDALKEGRFWTLLTSTYSHRDFFHALVNMMVFASFGPLVAGSIGTQSFLALYTLSGIIGSALSAAFETGSGSYGRRSSSILGASGSLNGTLVLFACMYPRLPVQLFFFIPVPAGLAVVGFIAYDFYRTWRPAIGSGMAVSHLAHLGGAFTGAMYYLLKIRR